MRTRLSLLAAAAGLALSGSALAQYTFPSFSLPGNRAATDTFSGVLLDTSALPAGTYTNFSIQLDWFSDINSASFSNAWSNEPRVQFANAVATGGTTPTYPALTTIYNSTIAQPTNGANNSNNVNNLTITGALNTNYTAGPLAFNFRQAFTGANVVNWNNIRITLSGPVPAVPGDTVATAINLGTLNYGGALNAAGTSNAGTVNGKWFKFNLSAETHDFLDLSTFGSSFDTEIGIYDAAGNLIASNDDDGALLTSLLQFDPPAVPAAGQYFVFVGGYNTAFGATGFGVTPGTAVGAYQLSIIPAPGAAALMGLGGFLAARRRRSN
ncbi:MAG: hypothetical protein K2Q20_05120 [Phycisphaerales bacterium]|nr:hypothetical protein [Phycisphaerales bacterium]